MITRRNLLGGAAVMGLLGAAGCSRPSGATDDPTTLVIASSGDNNSFDPTLLNIGNQLQYWAPVFDTLLTRDDDFTLQPRLATQWAYTDDSQRELVLTLRSGVTFSDGTPFNAEAVKANFANLAAGTGQNSYMTRSVKETQVVSETEARVILTNPDPSFIDYLAMVGGVMASPKSLKAANVGSAPVGSGPYLLDRAATAIGDRYVYTRNPDYWDTERFGYDRIIIRPMTDLTARLNALKSGQVNAGIADTTAIEEAHKSGLTVNTSPVDWVGLLLVDRAGTQVPALADVRVRQAINHAFDKPNMLKYLALDNGRVTTQIFNPVGNAYDPAVDDRYPFDLTKAKQLLTEAGFGKGFTLRMPEVAGFSKYNALIQQQLGEIGIQIDWVKIAANSTVPEMLSGRYPAFFMSLGSQSPWQDMQKAVIPKAPWNPLHVETPELNTLLQKAQFSSADEQPEAMKAVSRWLVDNAWFAPFFRSDSVYLSDPHTAVVTSPYNVAPAVENFTRVK